jgi:rhamnosyltransferase
LIAFFTILYKPCENALKNIASAKSNGFIPIVYLNSVSDDYIHRLNEVDVVLLGENNNVGLGRAFKETEKYLFDNGIKYFIYFDQDTIVNDRSWLFIIKSYEKSFKEEKTGLLFYGAQMKKRPLLVVSSGSLFSLDVIRKYGGHDENYFVEGVDYSYCLTLYENKLLIRNFYTDGIDHFSLQDNSKKRLFGFDFSYRCYGKSRVKDFNISHVKLISKCYRNRNYILLMFFLKSWFLFNLKEFYSRIIRMI